MTVLATMLLQSPWMMPVAIAVAAIVLAALLALYPDQLRDARGASRWAPPALRALAIVALAVAMVQPAVLRPRTAKQQGSIAILVDRSASMSVSDRGRSQAELVALAGGLGVLPPGARKESAPGLRAELEAFRGYLEHLERSRGEADYARLSGRGLPAAQARLKEATNELRAAAKDLKLPKTPGELTDRLRELKSLPPAFDERSTRTIHSHLDAAIRALAADQAKTDEKLFEENDRVRSLCIRTNHLSRLDLVRQGLTQSSAGLLNNLPAGAPVELYSFADDLSPIHPDDWPSADGTQSDITGSIHDLLRQLHGRDVQAIVLLTDGRQVSGDAPANPDFSALRAPIFAVGVAPPGQRRDISITHVDAPASARAGETITVRVDVRAPGVAANEPIDLQLDCGDIKQTQRVTVGEDWTASTEFDLTMLHAGANAITVTAMPLSGEISDRNNRAQRWVKVGADPLRVTVIAGADAGRQFAALHAVLSQAPWVTLREVTEANAYHLGTDVITSQHVVILCDLPPDVLSAEQWKALDTLVRQRGGSVIFCAGAHLPAASSPDSQAADWLPYEPTDAPSWQSWPGGEAHFRVVPDRSDESALASAWAQLAPLSRIAPIHKLRSGANPLLIDRSGGGAIVTESPRGLGKVVFISTDETWRWRAAGSSDRQQFWQPLLSQIAPQPYAAAESNVWLDASPIAPRPGQPINVRARLLNSEGAPIDASSQTLEVQQDGETIKTITLTNRGDGKYQATLDGLDEGDYALKLNAPPDPNAEIPPAPAIVQLHVAQNVESELADLSGDAPFLRRIAESSGGRYLPLEQINSLPRLLAENREKQTQFVEYTLWDSPYLFGLVLACLSGEWAFRKKLGLA